MGSRERPRDRALARAHNSTAEVGAQVRIARRGGGVSIREAAAAVGLDPSTFGRIERHQLANVTVRQIALACAAVGLDLGTRAYLAGEPVRDKAQLRLLDRFRTRLPVGSPWATEVPLPIPGDLRAIDAWTRLGGETIGIEAETRLADLQAVERKSLLKKRDAGLDRMILLVAETRANRIVLEQHREALRAAFPLDSRAVLSALTNGRAPTADGIVVL